MLKIWGRNTSSNVQKVIWALAEMKLPFERIDVGGAFGKTKEPFYLAMNPNSLVPTLEEDDGFILWESNSIVRYLAAKHGAGTLEPKDLHERARASDPSAVLGHHPHAAGEAGSRQDRRSARQDRRGAAHAGHTARQDQVRRR